MIVEVVSLVGDSFSNERWRSIAVPTIDCLITSKVFAMSEDGERRASAVPVPCVSVIWASIGK